MAAKGGTGREEKPALVTVRAGKTVAAPKVLLDRAGTVSRRVTAKATGAPVTRGMATWRPFSYRSGDIFGSDLDADGQYRVTGLAPCGWPLLFTPLGGALPTQWTGAAATPEKATGVRVTAGGGVALNVAAAGGTRLHGRLTGDRLRYTHVQPHHVGTGVQMAESGAALPADSYELWLLPGQTVKIGYWSYDSLRQRLGWRGGTSWKAATPVAVGAGPDQRVDIAVR